MENKNRATHSGKKRLLILMSAAAIASSGSFALPANSASAAAATVSDVAETPATAAPVDFITLLAYKPLSAIVSKTAILADRDYNELLDAVRSGRSLAAAAGMDAASLANALRDDYARELDREASWGILTGQQADEALRAATELFAKIVSGSWDTSFGNVFATYGSDIVNRRFARIVQDAAYWAGKSTTEVRQALRGGQTLQAAAARDPDADTPDSDDDVTLTEYLVGMLERDLDMGVKLGKLTAEDAAEQQQEGTRAIGRMLGTAGYEPETSAWMRQYGESLLDNRLDWIMMNTANLSDQSYGDVVDALAQGGNLVSASGMAESDLLTALGASADEAIESAWRSGSITTNLADELKQEAASRLREAVRAAGYGTAASADATSDSAVATASIRGIVEKSASYAGLSADEVRGALKAGKTLLEATDVDKDELVMALQSTSGAYIDAAVAAGTLARVAAAPTKAAAADLIGQAVETRGFTPEVDADAYVQERLARILEEAAALADKPANELLLSLAQGNLLTDEIVTDNDSLLYKLLREANRELNAFVASGGLTVEERDQALADYLSGLSDRLGLSE